MTAGTSGVEEDAGRDGVARIGGETLSAAEEAVEAAGWLTERDEEGLFLSSSFCVSYVSVCGGGTYVPFFSFRTHVKNVK